ncbi:MAG: fibronectin type III domain-containing protein [Chthonomonadales bacterium]|nr:fibronectin type III domain-containing protein [Chthonomonadales bacterium]
MRKSLLFAVLSFAALAMLSPVGNAQRGRAPTKPIFSRGIYTRQGIAVLGYAVSTPVRIITRLDGKLAWSGTIGNRTITTIRLPHGNYVVQAPDEIRIVSQNIVEADHAGPRPKVEVPAGIKYRPLAPGPLTIQPVPWVADASYASHPPSLLSRHTVFAGVPTILKAVVQGGTPPYTVDWDPGDGSPVISTAGIVDGYNGAAAWHTYSDPIGTPITAKITVTDAMAVSAVGYYYVIVGNPTVRSNRIARSTDEGLWYLHTQINRIDGYATGGHPAADVGYVYNYGPYGNTVGSSAMTAVCFSNTGRAITGGKNISNDPSKDAYVEDLNRLINWLTDSGNLYSAGITPKVFATFGPFNPDTHGPGGVPNGIGLRSSGEPIYEGGMQLQAISQAGYTEAPVPNRSDYASYYDLLGDFVDGMQYAQSESGPWEGGARYSAYPADSDGSAVGWYAIGLAAAQQAHLNTPNPGLLPGPIDTDPIFKAALDLWLTTNWHSTVAETVGGTDYRTGAARTFHIYGGQDYEPFYTYDNAGKTGGGLVALHHVGAPITDPRVEGALSYLYRWFFAPDYQLYGWTSARDAYGMYNMFKGLNAYGIGTLTDPMGGPLVDFDGEPNWSGQWFDVLADFIVGAAPTAPGPPTDLGHQSWPGNPTITSSIFSGSFDGHYEPVGARGGAIAPFVLGEWSTGYSDGSAGINLVTPWDILVCQSTVFTPPPVAVISRPSDPAGETYVPDQVGGVDHYAVFDPGGNGIAPDFRFGSYHLDPSRYVKKVRWSWGDGTPDVEYDLPFPGAPGGYVPTAPGIYPSGNQAVHHFSLGPGGTPIDRTVTLTVWDDAGQQSSTTVVVHVIPAPYPPNAIMSFEAQGASNQDGDTVGVLPDGKVTIKFTGTASYNPDPSSVLAPKNALGISQFWWEWPANALPYNTGLSEAPPLFDQGSSSGDPNLNVGSKDGVQTYTFEFNPASFPSAIIVGLRVKSNIVAVGVPDTATIYKTINLKDNASVTPSAVQIKNVSVHDITETSATISFDTTNAGGAPQLTKGKVDYGLTAAYGLTTPLTPAFQTHHTIPLSGLTASKTYHFKITATTAGGVSGSTSDATFTTLAPATPILRYRVLSRSFTPGYETVTYRVTNVGAGIALNVAFSGWSANKGVTLDAILTPLPTTIAASGGFSDITVRWALPTPAPPNFTSKFTCTFENSAAPPVSYTNTPNLLVFVP